MPLPSPSSSRIAILLTALLTTSALPAQSPPPPATATATATSVVAGVQSFYDRVTDFESQFTQVSRTQLGGTPRRAEGTVHFQRGGRMRWDYTTPSGDVIVSDGQTVQTYEAASRQLTRTPASQAGIAGAFSFLDGGARIANEFDARLLYDHAAAYPSGYVIELRPRHPHPAVDHLLLYVDGASYQVTRATIADAQQNTNAITFVAPHVNQHTDASVYRWTAPAGSQLVHP